MPLQVILTVDIYISTGLKNIYTGYIYIYIYMPCIMSS